MVTAHQASCDRDVAAATLCRCPARGYFFEVCDAVQTVKYVINGYAVCNFVYPEWFEQVLKPRSRRFDFPFFTFVPDSRETYF